MYQLQNFCFQKVQLLPNLIDSLLNLCNIFGVNFVRTVHSDSDLIDVVRNRTHEPINFLQFRSIQVDNMPLENHRPDKVTS